MTVKASLEIENAPKHVTFHFNPEKMSITKASGWRPMPMPGRATPPRSEYTGGQAASMTLEIILDTTDTGKSVRSETKKLESLIAVDKKNSDYISRDKLGRPPWVKVHWGDLPKYKWVCQNLSLSYVYFNREGLPLRAVAGIALTQIDDLENPAKTNPTSGTPFPHRIHTVTAGETLDRIAARYYGKSANWRLIADANSDVARGLAPLTPGTSLIIPNKRKIDRG